MAAYFVTVVTYDHTILLNFLIMSLENWPPFLTLLAEVSTFW